MLLRLLIAAMLVVVARPGEAAPIMSGSYVENADGTFTYSYEVSGVDPGRKVTGVAWVVLEGAAAPHPAYLPLSWTVPYFWSLLPGHGGPIAGGVWTSATGQNFSVPSGGTRDIPTGPNSGTLLAGDTRRFAFTTGYAPRLGTYVLVENQDGSEQNYQFLTGTVWLPAYDGSLVETAWSGQSTINIPTDPNRVPEPAVLTLALMGLAFSPLAGAGLRMSSRATAPAGIR
jgi:hypothetical protein